MKCPSCGAPIVFNEKNDYAYCSHCGTQVFKDGVTKHTEVYHEIDEARLKEAENYSKELDNRKLAFKFLMVITVILIIMWFFITMDSIQWFSDLFKGLY